MMRKKKKKEVNLLPFLGFWGFPPPPFLCEKKKNKKKRKKKKKKKKKNFTAERRECALVRVTADS